ncbi:MAG TPA: tetratricopeptide repeat protein [Gemmatimonas sp.]|uniref:tetratricopeptide repeat protein n=1 Tax=Gemmatimonas sp. TaxID=1962908 RepID=UPI002EDA2FE1
METVANWFQANSKPIVYVIGAAAVVTASIFVYRNMAESKREKASAALYEAQTPFAQGRLDVAQKALEKVTSQYPSTSSGQQAAVLLAQVLYEQKKYDDGIKVLEKALGSSNTEFKASLESLIAGGYEMKGDMTKAAEHYGKAAVATPFEAEKYAFEASQARSLMAAGKVDESRKLWEALAQLDGQPVQQEANIRLGELAAKK